MVGLGTRKVWSRAWLAGTAVVAGCLVPGVASAALPNFTWSGQGSSSNPFWSNAKNWKAGVVPHGSVGKLSFPKLGSACAPTHSSMKTCYLTGNDVSGLNVQAISIDDAEGYSLSGDGITLGSGGITAAPGISQCRPCGGGANLMFPIALSASQTWSMDAGSLGFVYVSLGPVTGASSALHIVAKNGVQLSLGQTEVGPVSITSPLSRNLFSNGIMVNQPGHPGNLNGTDAKPVHISGIPLASTDSVLGPLSASNHAVLWSGGFYPAGSLTVHGIISLASSSEVLTYITHAGSTPGTDYWQLKASGNVSLGGSHLILSVSNSKGFGPNQPCPKLHVGDVETLVSTTGVVQGKFEGVSKTGSSTGPIPNGAKIPITCRAKTQPEVRINYRRRSVTATVL